MPPQPTKHLFTFPAVVTVAADTREEAERLLAEQLGDRGPVRVAVIGEPRPKG